MLRNLHRTNERLEDTTTKYLVERQQNRPFHSTPTRGPVLEGPYVGNLTSSLLLDRNVTPRENVMIPTSRPQTSVRSIETHLIKVSYIIFLLLRFRFPIKFLFLIWSNSELAE